MGVCMRFAPIAAFLMMLLSAASAQASVVFQMIGYGVFEGYVSTWIPDKLLANGPNGDYYSVIYGSVTNPAGQSFLFDTIMTTNDRGGQIHPSTGVMTGYVAGLRFSTSPSAPADPRGGTTIYSQGYIPANGPYYVLASDAAGYLTATDVGDVPEPATWALLIAGFGLTGQALRRRRAGIALTT